MSLITIITAGNTYYVNEQDQFFYTHSDGYRVQPSYSWVLLGAVEYGRGYCGGRIIRQYTIADIRARRVPWHWRNGKQRSYVLQYDHGSNSVMMSPKLISVHVGLPR